MLEWDGGLRPKQMGAMKNTKLAVIVIIASAMALALGCGDGGTAAREQVQTVAYAYRLAPGATVSVRASNSAVTVRRSDSDSLNVTATLRNPSRIRFFVLPTGTEPVREILVSALLIDDKKGDASSGLALLVPDGVTLKINSTNGPLDVEGATLVDVNLVTTDAAVSVRSSRGDFTMNTTNGKLDVMGSAGTFWTQTTNGAIEFAGTIRSTRSNRFKTTSGDITVRLSGDPDLLMTVKAENGTVQADDATPVSEVDKVLTARYGEGAGKLDVETVNGNVRISRTGG